MNTIQEQWDHFCKLVMPENVPTIQRREMKRAFYAGAKAMINIQFAVGDPNLSDKAGVEILEGVYQECEQFGRDIQAGRA